MLSPSRVYEFYVVKNIWNDRMLQDAYIKGIITEQQMNEYIAAKQERNSPSN